MDSQTEIDQLLEYWFGKLEGPEDYQPQKLDIWFKSGKKYDHEIAERFASLHKAALQHDLDLWTTTPRGRLALILLLDQISRHLHRGSPLAFSNDQRAQDLVIEGLEQGDDQQLRYIERIFFYMPLQHAENISMQNLSVERYAHLLETVPQALKPFYQGVLEYAEAHHKVIENFGRFPELNQILNRPNREEEEEFLASGRYRFL